MHRDAIFEYVKNTYQTKPEYLWKNILIMLFYVIRIIGNGMPLLWMLIRLK